MKFISLIESIQNYKQRKYVRVLQEADNHIFFGYYDISPFSRDGTRTRVLALKTNHPLISPDPSSEIEVGYFDLNHHNDSFEFQVVNKSRAWCWQQGCRLQWYPQCNDGEEGKIFFNTTEKSQYVGIVQDLGSGEIVSKTPLPLYDISKCGTWGLSLNFSRLQRLRPGYGYTSVPDLSEGINIPDNDGIHLYNFNSGKTDLVLELSEVAHLGAVPEDWRNYQHYINHLSFNPSGTKFMFVHILAFGKRRLTRLMVCNTDGTGLTVINDVGKASHYTWKNDSELLNYCRHANDESCYTLYDVSTAEYSQVAVGKLPKDGHPTYFKNKSALLTDTYPNRFRVQRLIVYDLNRDEFLFNKGFVRSKKFQKEMRIDLHPRLSHNEKNVCIDDEMGGFRVIKLVDIAGIF